MAENTKIQWTTHTWNPWWGCTKVHAGCAFCYAEKWDARWGGDHWDKNPRRMVLGEWGKPAKWDKAARETGIISPVFCASMCDLFEEYDGPVVNQSGDRLYLAIDGGVRASPSDSNVMARQPGVSEDDVYSNEFASKHAVTVGWLRGRVFRMIEETPNLLWQLLTKRPENVTSMVPLAWLDNWPRNVITGTSPCNQATANANIPNLMRVPGRRFLSCEPLLGPIDFSRVPDEWDRPSGHGSPTLIGDIDWVIIGCESDGDKTNRLPDDSEEGYWEAARSIIKQCESAGVPVFHKQAPVSRCVSGDPEDWPEWAQVREMPQAVHP